ncbi:hypothetical protein F4779DRAFT_643012 [Xylariaceae sp. FL0662B]|nr:hypothetical protein F4779DRAFT_643012 [Xylariaceae sp. FL0662B]
MAGYSQANPVYSNGDLGEALEESQAHEESVGPTYEAEQRRIPLVCAICPKNSRFSDISHLLTHISSKGHLSTYFDLSISRDTDAEAAIALQEFDHWFENYGIAGLLRLRKTARATRGALQGRRSQTPNIMASSRIPTRRGGRGGRGNSRSRGRIGYASELVDIKYESEDDMDIGDSYGGASLHSWHAPLSGDMPHNESRHHEGLNAFVDEEDSSKYEPSDDGSSFPSENTMETTETDTGTLILKGAVYPGMGGFDAAREEQRRKRNQRKPPAVLQQLETNSVLVTTEEEVYDCNLEFQRTRDVYDEASINGSADEDPEEETEKKRKRRGPQTRATSTSRKTRSNTSREQPRVTHSTHATRATTRAAQMAASVRGRASVPARSVTSRGSMSQAQLPLHSHGFQGESDLFHDPAHANDGEGWTSLSNFTRKIWLTSLEEQGIPIARWTDEDDSLALRPGNPNLSFASPTPGLKRSPSLYPGKENNHLALKSPPTSSNPYLQPNDSMENSGYNPLYVQPRDGIGFRMYSSYDDDVKPVASGFQPINAHGGFNSLHMPNDSAAYHSNQPGGNDFDI